MATSNSNIIKILAVDDKIENLQVISHFLNDTGYQTVIASSGTTGLKRAQEQIPDMILLDIDMPGMDGFEVITRLKANPITKTIPVLFVTAADDAENINKAFQLGAVDYITKPVRKLELLARVKAHLHEAQLTRMLEQDIDAKANEIRTLAFLVESAATPIAMADMDRNITFVNPAFIAQWGYTDENQIIGRPITDFWFIADRLEGIVTTMVEAGGTLEEALATKKDGSTFQVETSAAIVYDENNTPLGMMASSIDITKRKESENKISQLRDYLANIIDSMPSMIIGVDSNEIITQWSARGECIYGISSEEALGSKIQTILPYFQDKLKIISEAIETGESQVLPTQATEYNGTVLLEEIIITPLTSDTEKGVVIRIDDVTEKSKVEQVMIQSEKLQSVAGLAAGMAHEINNPLGGIMQGYQNIINRIDPSKPKNQEAALKFNLNLNDMHEYLSDRKIITFLDGGRDACKRAAGIVKSMLLFSRKSSSELIPTDIKQLIEHTIELGATDYDMKKKYDFKFITINREYDKSIPVINCCPSEIEQVLLNLFKNALQAMEEKSYGDNKPGFNIRLKKEDCCIRIEVEDNGPGIPDDVKKRIFEPFFTTKPTGVGTGLGLSISYSIITQNHSGSFEIETKPGEFTKFIIRLPL